MKIFVGLIVGSFLMIQGCNNYSTKPSGTDYKPPASTQHKSVVTIKDYFFDPGADTIALGDTLLWANQGSANHTSTSGQGSVPDGKWNSGALSHGQTFSHVFQTAGTYPYYCTQHGPGMSGTVVVTP